MSTVVLSDIVIVALVVVVLRCACCCCCWCRRWCCCVCCCWCSLISISSSSQAVTQCSQSQLWYISPVNLLLYFILLLMQVTLLAIVQINCLNLLPIIGECESCLPPSFVVRVTQFVTYSTHCSFAHLYTCTHTHSCTWILKIIWWSRQCVHARWPI